MIKEFEKRNSRFINKVLLWGALIIFFIAGLFHFSYEMTGSSKLAAVFFPVNESIFEHLKLALYPTILYYLITFFIFKRDYKLNKYRWFAAMTFSIFTCILFIVSYYYVFNYALQISIAILDILSLLIGSILGQILGCHVYNRGSADRPCLIACIIILILTAILFANFTFYPPKVPLFLDKPTGTYGIK